MELHIGCVTKREPLRMFYWEASAKVKMGSIAIIVVSWPSAILKARQMMTSIAYGWNTLPNVNETWGRFCFS